MPLRRATGIELQRHGWWLFCRLSVRMPGDATFIHRGRAATNLEAAHRAGPALLGVDGTRALWWAGEEWYWDDESLTAEEVALTLWDRQRRRDGRFERLRRLHAHEEEAATARRQRIPEEVRSLVWARDEGRCVRCGVEEDLQFDHVIPFARGGGNAEENIQLLCGACNRAKGDAID